MNPICMQDMQARHREQGTIGCVWFPTVLKA